MRSLFATLRQLVLPGGAQPGTPRTILGPDIRTQIDAYYAAQVPPGTVVSNLIFERTGDTYNYLAQVSVEPDLTFLAFGSAGLDLSATLFIAESFRIAIANGSGGFAPVQVGAILNSPGLIRSPLFVDGPAVFSDPVSFQAGNTVTTEGTLSVQGPLIFDGEQVGPDLSWSPVWTQTGSNPTLNDGTLTGRYMRIGEWCLLWLRLEIGAGTVLGTGSFQFTIPFDTPFGTQPIPGYARDASAGANRVPVMAEVSSAGDGSIVVVRTSTGAAVTETVPFTWATGDILALTGWYLCTPP